MDEGCLHFQTTLGRCQLAWTHRGLSRLRLLGPGPDLSEKVDAPAWVLDAVERIARYLEGRKPDLGAIPLDLDSQPPFRRAVFEVLRALRPGQLLTYGEVALLAGSPGAARAVGQAVARNPLPILIPCHRVVASDGPGGFSLFGSLETKEILLRLEGHSFRHTETDAGLFSE